MKLEDKRRKRAVCGAACFAGAAVLVAAFLVPGIAKTERRAQSIPREPVLMRELWTALIDAGSEIEEAVQENPCEISSGLVLWASLAEVRSDFWLALAKADNLFSAAERLGALKQAKADLGENVEEALEQYDSRLELCEALGEDRYDPGINPDDFMNLGEIAAHPNQYMPLIPGTMFRYQGETEEGTEVIEVRVTHETKEILGVTCIVVTDTVRVDGILTEDTIDWFTQDKGGNVWYFGELSLGYEGGQIASLEGSWEAGIDGAKPGIVMKGSPQVGDIYRQEFALGNAEDAAIVLALGEQVTVPFGSFGNCLKTGEFTPIEPDFEEHKFYAPHVGLVLEVSPETGQRIELVSVVTE